MRKRHDMGFGRSGMGQCIFRLRAYRGTKNVRIDTDPSFPDCRKGKHAGLLKGIAVGVGFPDCERPVFRKTRLSFGVSSSTTRGLKPENHPTRADKHETGNPASAMKTDGLVRP